jgi:hypothetical protein
MSQSLAHRATGFSEPVCFELQPPATDGSPWWRRPMRVFLRRRVRLTRPLQWRDPWGASYEVPAGFETDGASVPMLLAPAFPSRFDTLEAGVLHDWLCSACGEEMGLADMIFRRALLDLGVRPMTAWLMWAGLRVASPFRGRGQRS